MAHIIEMTLNLKVDGVSYPNFPLIRRMQVDQLEPKGYLKTAGETYTNIASLLTVLQAAILTIDQPLSFRANGQSTGSIPVNAGGLICLFDTTVDTGTLLSVLSAGSTDANINGIVAGSK